MRRSSSSVKGSFCSPLPSADALPLGFFTCLDGLRSSHSLDRQKSKKARTTDMSRLAVGTLTFHVSRNARTCALELDAVRRQHLLDANALLKRAEIHPPTHAASALLARIANGFSLFFPAPRCPPTLPAHN